MYCMMHNTTMSIKTSENYAWSTMYDRQRIDVTNPGKNIKRSIDISGFPVDHSELQILLQHQSIDGRGELGPLLPW
jgi:hypothetical protein